MAFLKPRIINNSMINDYAGSSQNFQVTTPQSIKSINFTAGTSSAKNGFREIYSSEQKIPMFKKQKISISTIN